jgi:hypothetical protein
MQELDSPVMVIIREHGQISPHVVHDHCETLKHGIYGLIKEMSQAQRCTKQLSMIPTNESGPKHLRIKGTIFARKTDENSSKKSRKSNELQTRNRRNHETFHSLKGQILHKRRKNLTRESKEMRSSPDG